jgi:hypothetical protein
LRLPEFPLNWHIKVVRLSALRTGHFDAMILISVRGRIDPRAIVRPKKLIRLNITTTAVPQPTAPPRAIQSMPPNQFL